ncbi:AbrB/MazE/SpoVT family DNA-binding domain-containing protein [Halorubrum terrestre]|uniref:AbrB/MazE/SpoVT family DNA-binding domain-containing protein n=1 Tax=Halorubrum distributum TaxID=29283 RepID=A0A6B1IQY1_9EURY|nr:AbrB/MazE/SpoVT family DNA-binding domain-containing protein [Halorubrum terrestre]MYL18100.1 AbrB/MazE/SpoVT family DNA-binding domain-containing protein [Halorubrum terrestre]
MTKVDSKGLIVLPQEVRDRLGITPGTEVQYLTKHLRLAVSEA